MKSNFTRDGYILLPEFFTCEEMSEIKPVILNFHKAWVSDNKKLYDERAINSAYLTGTKYLDHQDRLTLFRLIASQKIASRLLPLPFKKPAFMNTQLFFNPANSDQRNYWHRDPQYHLSIEEQKQALDGPEVIHFRIPLEDEPGIELIPGTHKRWDTEEEFNVRTEAAGRAHHEDLVNGQSIPLRQGDLLIFSANIIHRGLYGKNRLALDILFCEAEIELLEFVDKSCLPDEQIMSQLECSEAFANTSKLLASSHE
ncbi:phytanoyl-CoA dioxygenase family protein [Endozoicomonas arenosclerae]|uniref:phytanoyl-CoA dioxygenase family protein n=1 Tax=Endozoicomonas arenosclerae TaxID=1633495 RepID=UPI00078363A0|nr:phytanoyl-CoA dioxygenase family protein [Endozoicomonas arenosclerae]